MNANLFWMAALLSALTGATLAQADTGKSIAGLAPAARPADAPRISATPTLDRSRALHGIAEPVPPSLRFLDQQGGWFNPFTHPGMTPPYDLRGWHTMPAPSAK